MVRHIYVISYILNKDVIGYGTAYLCDKLYLK